jgi:hypothetical protein
MDLLLLAVRKVLQYQTCISDRVPTFMCYLPKEGEQLVYEEIFIPDVN